MRGFTLIELLIVISIMAILTVAAIPGFNEYNRNQKINDAASNLQSVIRQVQNNAQTGTVCSNGSKATYWYIDLPFNGTNYSVGANCETGTQTLSQATLPADVIISDISIYPPNSTGTDGCLLETGDTLKVKFNNITSNVSFIDSSDHCLDNTNSNLEITLSLQGSQSKVVKIEKGGRIYVKP